MDTATRFFNDLASWYWWLSVVLVGLLINLASAYLKAPIDAWLSKVSVNRRARQQRVSAQFDKDVARIASDPTLLVLQGQAATHAESKVYALSTGVGANLIVMFLVSQLPEPRSFLVKTLMVMLVLFMPLLMSNWLSAMRAEARTTALFRAAVRRFGGEV